MSPTESKNLSAIAAYFAALEAGASGEELGGFFADDAVQIELPNRLHPHGARSDRARILERAERGRGLLASQKYTLHSTMAQGDRVAVEAEWHAVLAVAVGPFEAGATMTAHFAAFFTLVDGRIAEQRNYDCFEPW